MLVNVEEIVTRNRRSHAMMIVGDSSAEGSSGLALEQLGPKQ